MLNGKKKNMRIVSWKEFVRNAQKGAQYPSLFIIFNIEDSLLFFDIYIT